MYSPTEREEVLQYLLDRFWQRQDVLAVVLVGSGAAGFCDAFSDLDIVVVTVPIDIGQIFSDTYEDISSAYGIAAYQCSPIRNLQIFLLDNYLELDIGYYTIDTLTARRELFRVLYDKTGRAEQILEDSWQILKQTGRGSTTAVDMQQVIASADRDLWYSVMHAVIAFRRDDVFRCYYELQEIRSRVIDLIAKRYALESKRCRQINLLPEQERVLIQSFFTYPETESEISHLLNKMLDALFAEFAYWKEKEGIPYTSDKVFLVRFVAENTV